MKLGQAFKMAAKSIASNVGRSVLTMLGIIIGLAAVIILVSFAQGQNAAMKAYYDSMGSNIVNVTAYSWNPAIHVSEDLYDYCLELDDLILGITPKGEIWDQLTISYESKTLPNDGDWYTQTTVYMGNNQFGLCNEYHLAKGRELSFLDVKKYNQVCVLGSQTAQDLFSFADPLGKTIRINGYPFLVVGIYESKAKEAEAEGQGSSSWILDEIRRQDRMILIPSSMTRYFNQNQPIESYVVKVRSQDKIAETVSTIASFLKSAIPEEFGYGYVESPDTWQNSEEEASAMQQRFLGGIAAISLLVGGIGIMNIMLVTVTERTREIGIRKAIGAERSSIIIQFLIEAAMICGIGGLFGIGVGYVGTMIVGKLSFDTLLLPSPGVTLGAAAISVGLGILFGMYPAVKASGLQPVKALRAD